MSGTLIGGSAHQTRNGSDLRELLVIASDLADVCLLPPAFRRPKQRRMGCYADPPKKAFEGSIIQKTISMWLNMTFINPKKTQSIKTINCDQENLMQWLQKIPEHKTEIGTMAQIPCRLQKNHHQMRQ